MPCPVYSVILYERLEFKIFLNSAISLFSSIVSMPSFIAI